MEEMQVLIDRQKCTGCGNCLADCPRKVLEMQDGKAAVINSHCLMCGHCLAVCPANAIKLDGYSEEVLDVPKTPFFLSEKDLMLHLKFRRTIRQYKDSPVEREKLEKLIEAGRLTPTARNAQNVRYIVLQDELGLIEDEALEMYKTQTDLLESLVHYMNFPVEVIRQRLKRGFLFHNAPAVILTVSQSEINGCLAARSIELLAEALGLGTLYVGLFTRPANANQKIRSLLGIAKDENIAACLALGYPKVRYLRSVQRKAATVAWR